MEWLSAHGGLLVWGGVWEVVTLEDADADLIGIARLN
jgi:hypothetical protein